MRNELKLDYSRDKECLVSAVVIGNILASFLNKRNKC